MNKKEIMKVFKEQNKYKEQNENKKQINKESKKQINKESNKQINKQNKKQNIEQNKNKKQNEKTKVTHEKYKNERLSLKVRLILSHILIAVLPILIIVVTITSQAGNSLIRKVNSTNAAYVSKVTKIMDGKVDNITNISKVILADVELNKTISKSPDTYSDSYSMLQNKKKNFDNKINALLFSNNMVRSITVMKEDEVFGISDMDKKYKDEFFTSEVYEQVKNAGTSPVWFYNLYETEDIYFMKNLSNLDTGKFVGVLIIQVKKELFLEDLNSDFGNMAKLAMVDMTGQVVVAPIDQEEFGEIKYFNQILTRMDASANNNEELHGTFTTKDGVAEESTIIYGKCSNGWIYLLQIPLSTFLGDIEDIKAVAIMLTLMVIVAATLLGVWIALSISKPIDYLRKKIKLVEQGDLTVESNYIGKYELGQLSHSFNQMIKNMKELLIDVGRVVDTVSSDSKELNHIAKNSAFASKGVIQSVESVTNGATEQAKDAEKTTVIIKELVKQFNATEEHFSFVVKATHNTRKASQDAKVTLDTLNVTTSDTVALSQNILKDIKNLVNRFREITAIIGWIDDISGQTNLLALNATIEAARAGESGKGFAVVADEVRKLAVQSSDAVKNISSIINSINEEMTKTEKLIENGASIYTKQENALSNTEEIFTKIMNNMDDIMNEVNLVYGLLEGLDEVQVTATDSITSIAGIAQESAAVIEEILASGQEQMASADQLVEMSLELGDVIETMRKQMNQFIVEK